MTFIDRGPRATPPSHASHDRTLIAALVAGDPPSQELGRAQVLVDRCDECRTLAADLRLVARELRTLPPPKVPSGLNFTIDATRARKLHRWANWRRLLAPFSGNGSMLRPIAGALMTVGLAGLLVSTAPMLNLGFAGSAATSTENRDSQSPGVSTDSTPVPGTYAPETLASAPPPGDQSASGGGQYGEGAKTPDPTPAADRTDPNKQLSGTSAGESERLVRTTLPWGSGVLLVFGLGLLVTRRIARRLG